MHVLPRQRARPQMQHMGRMLGRLLKVIFRGVTDLEDHATSNPYPVLAGSSA